MVDSTPQLPRPRRLATAIAALVVGALYALVSAYWALGGRALLDTVGGVFERAGENGGWRIALALWFVVVVKLAAAALPLVSIVWPPPGGLRLTVRILAWVDAIILSLYGAVLTTGDLFSVAGVLNSGHGKDLHALYWHAFLWDPWFLVWGVLCLITLAGRSVREDP